MKLKSYFNPTPDANLCLTVQIRNAADAAPGGGFTLLGDLTHEPPADNASGMQGRSVSHAVYQHVQEQVYLQKKIQDMQKIKITTGGTFKFLKGMYIEKGELLVKPGEDVVMTVKVEPADATIDGYFCEVENPALGTVVAGAAGKFTITMPQDGQTIVKIGLKNTDLYELVPIEARTVVRQA